MYSPTVAFALNWLSLAAIVVLTVYSWARVEMAIKAHDRQIASLKQQHEHELKYLLLGARDESVRYEIETFDWGIEFLDMRYRWTVWDADRLLAVRVGSSVDEIGTTVPYMLGNAPTRQEAQAQALVWVQTQEQTSGSVVVTV